MSTNRPVFLVLTTTLALVFSGSVSQAATYYVSPTGNDTNSGTSTTKPWKTIGKVNSRNYVAGDKILFQGGQTFTGALTFTSSSLGTAANPITVSSYGTGKAKINAGTSDGIYGVNTGGFTISNLVVFGGWNDATQSGNGGSGINFSAYTSGLQVPAIKVTNCEVYGFKNAGINLLVYTPGPKAIFQSPSITNTTVHDNGGAGINLYGATTGTAQPTVYSFINPLIKGVRTYNNKGLSGPKNNVSGSGIVLQDTKGGVIDSSIAYYNGGSNTGGGGGPYGIWAYDSTNLTIQNCESYGNETAEGANDGGGFDLDGGCTDSYMQYNYSHDNRGAGYLLCSYTGQAHPHSGNVARFNISENDGIAFTLNNPPGTPSAGIYVFGDCSNDRIFNNTVYSTVSTGLHVYLEAGQHNWVFNNIFFSNTTAFPAVIVEGSTPIDDTEVWLINNDYWGGTAANSRILLNGTTYRTLNALRATYPSEESLSGVSYGFIANPKLVAPAVTPWQITNYNLQSTSPLLNAGLNFGPPTYNWVDMGTRNFAGLAIPPLNVGAN